MLAVFSYIFWLSVCSHWRNVYLELHCPFKLCVFSFFFLNCKSSSYIICLKPLRRHMWHSYICSHPYSICRVGQADLRVIILLCQHHKWLESLCPTCLFVVEFFEVKKFKFVWSSVFFPFALCTFIVSYIGNDWLSQGHEDLKFTCFFFFFQDCHCFKSYI